MEEGGASGRQMTAGGRLCHDTAVGWQAACAFPCSSQLHSLLLPPTRHNDDVGMLLHFGCQQLQCQPQLRLAGGLHSRVEAGFPQITARQTGVQAWTAKAWPRLPKEPSCQTSLGPCKGRLWCRRPIARLLLLPPAHSGHACLGQDEAQSGARHLLLQRLCPRAPDGLPLGLSLRRGRTGKVEHSKASIAGPTLAMRGQHLANVWSHFATSAGLPLAGQ